LRGEAIHFVGHSLGGLMALRALKLASAPAGEVVVYQIGDLFDLWRQVDGRDPNANAASAIQNDHASLLAALRDPDLNTQFLLGNHDYDLYRFTSFADWQRSYVLAPSVMLLHGDVFDWVEKLPDELQNWRCSCSQRTCGHGRSGEDAPAEQQAAGGEEV
jgi:pimeloyl-ACP methyl ester carboxylesterase